MTEIDNDYFCSCQDNLEECEHLIYALDENREKYGDYEACESCNCRHRQRPTPDQFREEYGRDPSGMPYYCLIDGVWECGFPYKKGKINVPHVIACTPYGKPDKDWRPSNDSAN